MPRPTARLAVVVSAAVLALSTLPVGTTSAPGPPRRTAGPTPAGSTTTPGTTVPALAGRTPYEKRLLDARRGSVSLEPVVGHSDRPNILVLMTDDMRDDDLRFMPHVQELIGDQGVHFANMFSPQPLCCPARASFSTGLYSHNHHVWSHVTPYGFRTFDDRQTLPVWLHELGYDTTFLGKYLNGYGRQPKHGRPSLRYVPPGWTDWRGSIDNRKRTGGHLSGGTYRYFDTTLSVNGKLEPHDGEFQTHLYSRLTQQMIRRESRSPNPFFAWISLTTPHSGSPKEKDDPQPAALDDGSVQTFQNPARPDYVKGRFDQRISRIPGGDDPRDEISGKPYFIRGRSPMTPLEEEMVLEDYRQRAEALSVVDDEVVNIVESLERSGELDNTYIVFTSDNGYFLGEHRMRQGKILPYEPSLRVPLMMRGPGIPEGVVRTDPFLMPDFAPTLLEAAGGVPSPMLDGQSMLPVARYGDRGWTRGILTETGPRVIGEDVKESDNFLVSDANAAAAGKGSATELVTLRFSIGVRTGRYLYVEHVSNERELYDLKADPRQFHNIVEQPRMSRVVRLLARELRLLKNCVGPACRRPLPPELQMRHPAPEFTRSPVRR